MRTSVSNVRTFSYRHHQGRKQGEAGGRNDGREQHKNRGWLKRAWRAMDEMIMYIAGDAYIYHSLTIEANPYKCLQKQGLRDPGLASGCTVLSASHLNKAAITALLIGRSCRACMSANE